MRHIRKRLTGSDGGHRVTQRAFCYENEKGGAIRWWVLAADGTRQDQKGVILAGEHRNVDGRLGSGLIVTTSSCSIPRGTRTASVAYAM